MSDYVRSLGTVGLGVLGALTGVCGAVVSRMDARVLGVPLPYGLVLAIAAATLLFWQARKLRGLAGATAAALGWGVPVVIGLWPRPEGDIVFAADGFGLGYICLGVVAAAWNVGRARDHHEESRTTGMVDGRARRTR
ncbi:DUF6113 family protein [Actinopolymorpha sp. B17G11]|uniref:DUF6113 family protein n=1 Tax=unclassified Actinopolymorpha TaxID=2627063 RepID=UPI0032D8E42D